LKNEEIQTQKQYDADKKVDKKNDNGWEMID